jgi:DNA helicase-2/ATP-dependent DNA helicase PcrA
MTQEQQDIIDFWGKSLAVIAGAGTGKTTTFIKKCLQLLKEKPDARFVAISFTQKSATELQQRLTKAFLENHLRIENHWILTIHGFCFRIIKENPFEAQATGQESILSEMQSNALWEETLKVFLTTKAPLSTEQAWDRLLEKESLSSLRLLLERLRQTSGFGALQSLSQKVQSEEKDLITVFLHLQKNFDILKKKKAVFQFDDLEQKALFTLQSPFVQKKYHQRFDLVLVDEFQDTNPLQSLIIEQFCKKDLSNLCIVGDPSQSIYRFRDADVSVFNAFCEKVSERKQLSTNFRSAPGILQFVNTVCKKAFAASDLNYLELTPPSQPPSGIVDFFGFDSALDFAEWMNSHSSKHTAVLLRRLKGSEKWLHAFMQKNTPIALNSSQFFWQTPCIQELMGLFRWWQNPKNTLSAMTFLRAPWVGISDLTLDTFAHDLSLFFEQDHPIAQALKPLRNQVIRPAAILLTLLDLPSIAQEIGPHGISLWQKMETLSLEGSSFYEVIQTLCDRMEQREPSIPSALTPDTIQVMTIHAAKGLEFDHVVLLDFPDQARRIDNPALFWDKDQGAYLSKRKKDGSRDAQDKIESQFRKTEHVKSIQESKRLFYVAMTRAKKRLSLCRMISEKSASDEFSQEDLLLDHWLSWVQMSVNPKWEKPSFLTKSLLKVPTTSKEVVSTQEILPENTIEKGFARSRHSVTDFQLLKKCPLAYQWQNITPEIPFFLRVHQNIPLPSSEKKNAKLGSQIHAVLSYIQTAEDLFEHQKKFEELACDDFHPHTLIHWIKNSAFMQKNAFEVNTEFAFELAMQDQGIHSILVGAIDRLLTHQDHAVILDFKILKSASEKKLQQRYRLPLSFYAQAVKKLQPSLKKIECYLIAITPESVKEIPIFPEEIDFSEISYQAQRLFNEKNAVANPSDLCRYCDFQDCCSYSTTKALQEIFS